jgi:hypothetical protein
MDGRAALRRKFALAATQRWRHHLIFEVTLEDRGDVVPRTAWCPSTSVHDHANRVEVA